MQNAHSPDQSDAVRVELERILSSQDFAASERNRRFLAFVVEETLSGRADRIKAYTIATTVFGRDENFDSQLDSIVRIEAGRLRRSLEHYYLTAGARNPLRIFVPRGTYVPRFIRGGDGPAEETDHIPAPMARPGRNPNILVLDFVDESAEQSRFLASGLTRQIVVGLTRFSGLNIFGENAAAVSKPDADLSRMRSDLAIDFFIAGGLYHMNGTLHLDVMLIDANSGRYLWAETFERPCESSELFKIRDEIASNVVRTLAQPWGVIFSNLAAQSERKRTDDMSSFDAIIRYHQYAANFDSGLYPMARKAIERAVSIDRDFGDAWACLAMLQTAAIRFGYHVEGDPPPEIMARRAIESARRAVSLWPHSSQSFSALGQAYWFTGDIEGGLKALTTASHLNPNDMDVMAELGLRQCFRMEWGAGVSNIVTAYERHPSLPSNYRVGLALWHLAHGRMKDAHSEAMRMIGIPVVYPQFLLAVTAHALGWTDEASAAVRAILDMDPHYASRVEEDLAMRCLHPDLIVMLVAGLRAAGLPVAEPHTVGVA